MLSSYRSVIIFCFSLFLHKKELLALQSAPSITLPQTSPSVPTTQPPSITSLSTPASQNPPPTEPSTTSSPSANFFNAQQTTNTSLNPSIITPVSKHTSPLSTSTTSSTLGSGITKNNIIPGQINVAPAPITFTANQLSDTKTLNELVNGGSQATSIYASLLESGTNLQKTIVAERIHTDPFAQEDGNSQSFSFGQTTVNPMTAGAQQITQKTKFDIPKAAQVLSRKMTLSVTRHKLQCTLNQNLFDNSRLEKAYQNLVQTLTDSPTFLPLFTKFHILALAQLYQYLIGIYTTLTLTSIPDIDAYIMLEQAYGLSKKALIVQYLVSLVERQLNQALIALFPDMQKSPDIAIHAGLSMLNTDHMSRLDLLFIDIEKVVLATFGIPVISREQWQTVYTLLTDPTLANGREIVNQQSLAQIAEILEDYIKSLQTSPSSSFISNLSQIQQSHLIDFLDIITAQFSQAQQLADVQQTLSLLQGESTQRIPTAENVFLQMLVRYYVLRGSTDEILSQTNVIHNKLDQKELLTIKEKNYLTSLLAMILFFFEQDYIASINTGLQPLEIQLDQQKTELSKKQQTTFTTYKNNNVYQKMRQKELAQSLQKNPALLQNLSLTQQATLTNGIASYSATHSLNAVETDALNQLSQAIESNSINFQMLPPTVQTLYDMIITSMAQYTLTPYTTTELSNDIENFFGKELDKLSKKMNGFNFTSPSGLSKTFSTTELLGLYCTGQDMLHIGEIRSAEHQASLGMFEIMNLYGQEIKKQILSFLTFNRYETLYSIYSTLINSPQTFSFSELPETQQSLLTNLLSSLTSTKTRSLGVFPSLVKSLTSNSMLTNFFNSFSNTISINSYDLAQKINSPALTPALLSPSEQSFLTETLQAYSHFLATHQTTKIPSSKTFNQGLSGLEYPLSQPEQSTAQTVLSVLHATLHLQKKQNTNITALGTLFTFFSTYTSLMHIQEGQNVSVIDANFNKFTAYARSIASKLEQAGLNNSNPPLFMYDQKTLEHISFLPILASEIEGTHSVPLPRQAVDMALLLHPVSSDGTPSATNNQILLQQDAPLLVPSLVLDNPDAPGTQFSPKFFFKDEKGKPFANQQQYTFPQSTLTANRPGTIQNPAIAWLVKQLVPTSNPTPYYEYHATRPYIKQEGLFINIPVIMSDTVNPKEAVARLYEQKIIPQPNWLNETEGVIGMMRGCLGDFVTAFSIDETIFDPIISYIIQLTLLKTGTPYVAGVPSTQHKITSQVLANNIDAAFISCQEEVLAQEVGDVVIKKTALISSSEEGAGS